MLEWLMAIGTAELGKVFFEQGLKLTQSAGEDYVKEFFKGCLKEGVAATKPEVAKKAVATALKELLLLIEEELLDWNVSAPEFRDRYEQALQQFLTTDAVKPALGKAFEQDCRQIDVTTLETIWQQSAFKDGKPFPAMPAGFDWQRIGNEYVKKVRRTVRETPELKSLLDTELLENIDRNTTRISPGFDVAGYRARLQQSYGSLKLHEIDCTDQQYRMKLWNLFIEPTVRESLPPSRYELPIDLQRRFHPEALAALSEEHLERYRGDYFEKSPEKVLSVLANSHHAVVLGDPGAGKSTLLQYLALAWVEGTLIPSPSPAGEGSQIQSPSPMGEGLRVRADRLPLLIELREYAIAQSPNFLEFLHSGRGVDWQFDRQQLHQHLQDQPTLVMFDGLDEVFDRATQAAIIDDIIRFAGQYPQAQVLITSRPIGYNPEKLQQAEFRHFTIQPLSTEEIHEFIDRWYDLAMGSDADKERLKQRLKAAIANSKAIQNLADNPLLLTMMAILNRRQELPRDRAELYDQASRVLLHNWDVDHKRLKLPLDTIGRREKQEMLRLVAYEMQAGEDGLKGNAIDAGRLTQVLTNYLKEQGFSEPREKANLLIDQLRHRNFILCDRGGDIYGFVHRTFLEYFCAVEIVHRFEKQRTLTFDQLRDEVFGQHWQDETWHEVLRLICGMIDAKFVEHLIDSLIEKEINLYAYLDQSALEKETVFNLILASDCFAEISKPSDAISTRLLQTLKQKFQEIHFDPDAVKEICEGITKNFKDDSQTLAWFQEQIQESFSWSMRWGAAWTLSKHYQDDPKTLPLIHARLTEDENEFVRAAALNCIAFYYRDSAETLAFLKHFAQHDSHWHVRTTAVEMLETYGEDLETLNLFYERIQQDEDPNVRQVATIAFVETHYDGTQALDFLKSLAQVDKESTIRALAVRGIAYYFSKEAEILELFCHIAQDDPFQRRRRWQDNPRHTALHALLTHYPTHPKTLELLRDRAENDPDEQLREWAQEQLEIENVKLEIEGEEK